MVVVVVAFDSRVLDGSVRPFDLTVDPGMVDLVKRCSMSFSRQRMANMRHRASSRAGGVAGRITELVAVVGQDRVDLVWHGGDRGGQEG